MNITDQLVPEAQPNPPLHPELETERDTMKMKGQGITWNQIKNVSL